MEVRVLSSAFKTNGAYQGPVFHAQAGTEVPGGHEKTARAMTRAAHGFITLIPRDYSVSVGTETNELKS